MDNSPTINTRQSKYEMENKKNMTFPLFLININTVVNKIKTTSEHKAGVDDSSSVVINGRTVFVYEASMLHNELQKWILV